MKTKLTLSFIIALSLIGSRSFSQTTPKDTLQSAHTIENDPNQPYYQYRNHNHGKKHTVPDSTVYKTTAPVGSMTLTAAQIHAIVGNDKMVSKDAQGRQLYQDSNNKQYYLAPDGTKMYVK